MESSKYIVCSSGQCVSSYKFPIKWNQHDKNAVYVTSTHTQTCISLFIKKIYNWLNQKKTWYHFFPINISCNHTGLLADRYYVFITTVTRVCTDICCIIIIIFVITKVKWLHVKLLYWFPHNPDFIEYHTRVEDI